MKCPGQDMQYWKDDAIFEVKCPDCQALVEFYKDDTTRKCHKCGHRFVNPKMDFGCATYCQFAEQCLGTLPEEFVLQQDNLLKDKVAVAMKRYFKSDFKRISQATKLARHAEKIGRATEGANLALILCSAYLLNIGYSKAAAQDSCVEIREIRKQGVPVAREILQTLGAAQGLIEQVICIIQGDTTNPHLDQLALQIVDDAQVITDMEEAFKENRENLDTGKNNIDSLNTEAGKAEALSLLTAMSA